MDPQTIFLLVFGLLAIFAIVFIFFREFWCWYFKINQRVELLEKIVNLLQETKPLNSQNSQGWICPKCKHQNPISIFTCKKCGFNLK